MDNNWLRGGSRTIIGYVAAPDMITSYVAAQGQYLATWRLKYHNWLRVGSWTIIGYVVAPIQLLVTRQLQDNN